MREYLKIIAQRLKNYSISLKTTSILLNKPWALIDDEFEMQKLIFKNNNQLIMAKNGKVQIGKWEYLPVANSILIDRKTDKILCNLAFVNEGALILKLDGTNNHFFVLANENIVPDLNVFQYLKNLAYEKLNIIEIPLHNNIYLQVYRKDNTYEPERGDFVTINFESVENGIYKLKDDIWYYEIIDSRINKILYETKYINHKGQKIELLQQYYDVVIGDYIKLLPDTKNLSDENIIDLNKNTTLIVKEGKIVDIKYKNVFIDKLKKIFKKK